MSADTTATGPDAPIQDRAPHQAVPAKAAWTPVARVNLLPPEIVENRQFRRMQKYLVACVAGTVVVAGALAALAQVQVQRAEKQLEEVQAQTSVLNREKAKYAEVPRVLAQVEAAEAIRERAMATDVLWYRYLNDLALATPSQVWLTDITATVSDPVASAQNAGAATDPLAPTGIGSLSFTASGLRFPDVASWMDALEGIPGFDGVTLQSATGRQSGAGGGTAAPGQGATSGPVRPEVIEFNGTVVVTEGALSHSPRYNRKSS